MQLKYKTFFIHRHKKKDNKPQQQMHIILPKITKKGCAQAANIDFYHCSLYYYF